MKKAQFCSTMKQTIQISRTAHYYLSKPTTKPSSILIALHGYAQLASEFILPFKELNKEGTLVVAPEALSKFYNKERRPVANWMTSQHREDEIADYIGFLNTLITHITADYPELPISVVAFSQGVSTAMRWITNCSIRIDELHLCSGSIPPELSAATIQYNMAVKTYYYLGSNDRLLKPDKAEEQVILLQKLGFPTQKIKFDGRHEISKECIDRLFAFSRIS